MSDESIDSSESTARVAARRGLAARIFSGGVDSSLIALFAFGCYFAIQSGLKKSEIEFHLKQLAANSEEVSFSNTIDDPNRIYVEAIETGKSLEFAWRVYLPKGFSSNALVRTPDGAEAAGKMAPLAQPTKFIARFKIKLVGEYAVCERFWLGETRAVSTHLHDSKESLEYLKHFGFSDPVVQAGKDEIQSYSKEDDMDLLKLSVPYSQHTLFPGTEPGRGVFLFSIREDIKSFFLGN